MRIGKLEVGHPTTVLRTIHRLGDEAAAPCWLGCRRRQAGPGTNPTENNLGEGKRLDKALAEGKTNPEDLGIL
jgi:hypothetical protein